ncbi:MAG: TrmH family RNA methyltransferase [Bacteroidia bacterium]
MFYLDAIRDPGNMGSLIRLADWFGVEAVICSSDCVEWTNPKVIQASMGSFIRKTPFVEAGEPGSFLAGKNRVIAADLAGEDLYREFGGFAGIFIISNEANGLSSVLEPIITSKVHIPSPTGSAESLNAATAAAVLLGELTRRQLTGQLK